MSQTEAVEKLFDEWAEEDGAIEMSHEHWPRVSQVLKDIAPSSGNYLEVGVGNGYTIRYIAEAIFSEGRCYGVDISQGMVECAVAQTAKLGNVKLEVADFLSWRSPDEIDFDLIFSMEVFYYFEDVEANIRKAANLLSPNGELIIMVDYFLENPSSHFWEDELGLPLALWSKSEYSAAFSAAGLADVRQVVISGGHREQGFTLCTRGRKVSRNCVSQSDRSDLSC